MNTNDKTTTDTTTTTTVDDVKTRLSRYFTVKNVSIAVAIIAGVAATVYMLKDSAVAVGEAVVEAIE